MSTLLVMPKAARPRHPNMLEFAQAMDGIDAVSYGMRLVRAELRRKPINYRLVQQHLRGMAERAELAAALIRPLDGGGDAA